MKRLLAAVADAVARHPTIRQILRNTQTIMADQDKLDSDVRSIATDFATAIAELKAQISANPTAPATSLDFTKLDALAAAVHSEAVADAPTTVAPVQPQP